MMNAQKHEFRRALRAGSAAALIACLASLHPARAGETLGPAPVAACAVAAEAPVIDGDLGDPAWREATHLGPFVRIADHDEPSRPTSARATRDDEWLYLAFECHEPDMAALSVEADRRDHPRAWADDCVQVFIAPGDPREVYYHFIVTARNVVFDERVMDGHQRQPTWSARVRSAVRRAEDRWTVEMALRPEDLGITVGDTQGVAFNVARAQQSRGEWSSWSALNANFHEFQNFGRLTWDAEPIITGVSLPSPFVGRNEFRLSVGAAAGTYEAELQIVRKGMVYPKATFPVAARTSASFGYSIQEGGVATARLIVRPAHGQPPVYATAPLRFEIPPVRSLAQEMATRLTAAAAVVATAGDEAVVRQLTAEIAGLKEQALGILQAADRLSAVGRVQRSEWIELHRQARALAPQARISELKGNLAGLGVAKMPSFALGVETSLRKLAPDDNRYSISRELRLQGARRERESGQVVVASLGEEVAGARVQWTGLRGPDQARIAHEHVAVHRVGYVTTRRPVYPVERVGRWPDPLLPPEQFDVSPREIQPLWVTVTVPPDTPPGEYVGEISVSTDADPPQTVRLVLEVWDIELPARGRLRTGFGNVFRGDVCQWYGFAGDPPEDFRRKFYDVLLSNRVNPAGLYVRDMWPLQEDLEWCLERGLNAVCLGNLGLADLRRLQELARAADWLRERKLLDIAYVFGFSNLAGPDDLDRAREGFSRVRRLIPGLRRASPHPPIKPLWGYVNIWGVLTSDYDHIAAQRRRRLGEEVWWYVGCGPRRPYANLFIDYPATDARTLFWAAFKHRISGFFYYEVAMWASNMLTQDIGDPSLVIHEDPQALDALRQGKRWPDVPWNTFTFSRYNGDGQLIYPGRNETPLPSLRLEVIRDGIEDYELLALLEDAALRLREADAERQYAFLVDESMRLAEVDPRVVTDLTRFTDDPRVIAEERERVARQLMRLQRTLRDLADAAD